MSGTGQRPTLERLNDSEEDLDDLDDILDQFDSAQKQPPSASPLISPPPPPPTAAATATFNRPRTNTRVDEPPKSIPGTGVLDPTSEADEDSISADFAKELAKGMESLMREIGGGAESGAEGERGQTDEETAKAFKAAWEAMLVDGLDGDAGDDSLASLGELLGEEGLGPSTKGKAKNLSAPEQVSAGGSDFQNKIKQAMDKLKESESNLKDAGAKSGAGATPSPESLEALLSSLGDLGLGEGEDDTELAGFLENMMGQLMSKEVLYEPLKELADSFPPYLAHPPAPLEPAEKQRYESQLTCVQRIIAEFDKPGYSDSIPEKNKVIVDLMSEMQTYGSPPAELMGPLPPGLDGMSQLGGEEGCVVS